MRQRAGARTKKKRPDGQRLWAHRYRPAGRDSKRLQRGGFTSAGAARAALEHAIVDIASPSLVTSVAANTV